MLMNTIKCFFLLTAVLSFFSFVKAQTVELRILNVRSNTGQLCVGVFDSQESFKKEQPCFEKICHKNQFEEEHYSMKIQLPAGVYGISVLDDENMDGKMNYSLIGVPTEGFGFGGYKHKGLKKPVFDNFSFSLEEGQHIQFDVELRYFELNFKK